jgi:hydroxyacylglutathione hydrolase
MHLHPLAAFTDNYIWMLHDGARALVVDPGEASGVQAYLAEHRLTLDTILITHHHVDHTGGVAVLREATGSRVIGPVGEPMPEPLQRVAGGQTAEALGLRFVVIDVPGHTAGPSPTTLRRWTAHPCCSAATRCFPPAVVAGLKVHRHKC